MLLQFDDDSTKVIDYPDNNSAVQSQTDLWFESSNGYVSVIPKTIIFTTCVLEKDIIKKGKIVKNRYYNVLHGLIFTESLQSHAAAAVKEQSRMILSSAKS